MTKLPKTRTETLAKLAELGYLTIEGGYGVEISRMLREGLLAPSRRLLEEEPDFYRWRAVYVPA